ncbi:MAG TPA: DUF3052 domain-containing protein [Blastocatellia bacterium]|jgi:hypothetical protein|nr:DUF3052 domain-containing protein [Blastocatellia bacterium]
MPDYSGTPLIKKLGIKEGHRVHIINAPGNFVSELGDVPSGVALLPSARRPLDCVLLFAESESFMRKRFERLALKLSPAGMIWVAWPKKSSGLHTDLSFDRVQKAGLELGLVDTKICAVNETWSGLRFVIRLKDRVPD